eukprot:TRINITY_DN11902_c0_g1_i2.p1 TRINITY_DN11902_c0_g1~~TRINITY_DN11902_c0_g1_i2.p1  ORF type:complete len:634 (-),score=202.11 TRINITY_DN11902_c0_g1_i2:72-1973(-)
MSESKDVEDLIRSKQRRLAEVESAMEHMPGKDRAPLLQLVDNLNKEIAELQAKSPSNVEMVSTRVKLDQSLAQNRKLIEDHETERAQASAELARVQQDLECLKDLLSERDVTIQAHTQEVNALKAEIGDHDMERDLVMAAVQSDEYKRAEALLLQNQGFQKKIADLETLIVDAESVREEKAALAKERALVQDMLVAADPAVPFIELDGRAWEPLMQLLMQCEELQSRNLELSEARTLEAGQISALHESNQSVRADVAQHQAKHNDLNQQLADLQRERRLLREIVTAADPSQPFSQLGDPEAWAPLLQTVRLCPELEATNQALEQRMKELEQQLLQVHSLSQEVAALRKDRVLLIEMVQGDDPAEPFLALEQPADWEPLMKVLMRVDEQEVGLDESARELEAAKQREFGLEQQIEALQQLMHEMREDGRSKEQLAASVTAGMEEKQARLEAHLEATRLKLLGAVSTNFKHNEARSLEASARKAAGGQMSELRENNASLVEQIATLQAANDSLRAQVEYQQNSLVTLEHTVWQAEASQSPVRASLVQDRSPTPAFREHNSEPRVTHSTAIAFDQLDTNKDGVINRAEFSKLQGGREMALEELLRMDEADLAQEGALDGMLPVSYTHLTLPTKRIV